MSTKVFFTVFFSLIALAIANTYWHIYVRHDFTAYSDEESVPSSLDLYETLYAQTLGRLNH